MSNELLDEFMNDSGLADEGASEGGSDESIWAGYDIVDAEKKEVEKKEVEKEVEEEVEEEDIDATINKGYKTDEKGNLIDPKTGEIVAQGGKERRLVKAYEGEVNRLKGVEAELAQKLDSQQRELEAYKSANTVAKDLGIDGEQLKAGAQFIKLWMTNPTEAVKELLAEYSASGYDASNIVGVDTSSIKKLIEKELAPVRQKYEQEAEVQQQYEQRTQQLSSFYRANPDAVAHESELSALLQAPQFAHYSPEQGYLELIKFAQRNGLELGKPFAQQWAERAKQKPNGQIPNGRGGNVSSSVMIANEEQVRRGRPAAPEDSWADIAESTMRDLGF